MLCLARYALADLFRVEHKLGPDFGSSYLNVGSLYVEMRLGASFSQAIVLSKREKIYIFLAILWPLQVITIVFF